jgi:predicted Zn-dependent protease
MRNRVEAESLAARAATLAPDDPYVLGTYGAARLRTGDPAHAAELLGRALAKSRPAAEEATDRYLYAIALAKGGRPGESREALDKARKQDSESAYRAEAESALAAASAETQKAPAP